MCQKLIKVANHNEAFLNTYIHIYLLKSHLIYKYNTFMIFKMVKKGKDIVFI